MWEDGLTSFAGTFKKEMTFIEKEIILKKKANIYHIGVWLRNILWELFSDRYWLKVKIVIEKHSKLKPERG